MDRKYFDAAYQLGKGMAQRGIMLVNGAGNQGLMNASANGCLQNGGQALGVIHDRGRVVSSAYDTHRGDGRHAHASTEDGGDE